MSISASSLARLINCPGSAALPRTENFNEYAELGTAEHATHTTTIRSEDIPAVWRALTGDGENLSELKVAYDVANRTGRVIGEGSDRNYGELAPFEIPGSVDWVVRGDKLYVVDFKTGFNEVEPASSNPQLWLYAIALARAWNYESATVVVLYTNAPIAPSVYEIDSIEMAEFARKLENVHAAVAAQKSKTVPDTREGSWCKHCPALAHCPAKTALIKSFAGVTGELTQDAARVGYEQIIAIEQLIKNARARLNSWVTEHGSIALGNGKSYGAHEKRGNEKIDPRIAAEAIRDVREDANRIINESVNFTKAGLERALGDDADAVMRRIRELGGFVRGESTKTIGEYKP